MSYASSIPGVITALAAAFRAASAGSADPFPVYDGAPLISAKAAEGVGVAYTGDPEESVVEGSSSPVGLAPADRETYAIMCAAEVVDYSGNLAAARARAYELQGICGQAVNTSQALKALTLSVSVGIASLTQPQHPDGALARVVFPVNVEAFAAR